MTRRGTGGILGVPNTPTTSAAPGIWTLAEQERWKNASAWPSAPTVPGAPTSVSATAGNAQATVSFTAPASDGGSSITGYTVTSSPGSITASGSSSPIVVTGLTNGTPYTFTVQAVNIVGAGTASDPSGSVTPQEFNNPSSIDLLVVAGGGGGAYSNNGAAVAGAGGAGGYVYQTSFAVSSGVYVGAYTVTVGGGGAVGVNVASRGGNSQFGGPKITTQTAYGGGAGGTPSGGPAADSNGGSGGGGGANSNGLNYGRGVYPGSTYIDAPRQGYDGGGGGGLYGHGGGGGGAGGAGGSGPGGAGVNNSITGSSILYARGGTWPSLDAGTPNTGFGGNTEGGSAAIVGDSGIVVLRYPDSYDAALSTTGSPTITVSGGYRIYKFTGSGSITFGG